MSKLGWQPRRCVTCTHVVAEHQSNGTSWPHPLVYGICLHPECDCKEFVELEEAA